MSHLGNHNIVMLWGLSNDLIDDFLSNDLLMVLRRKLNPKWRWTTLLHQGGGHSTHFFVHKLYPMPNANTPTWVHGQIWLWWLLNGFLHPLRSTSWHEPKWRNANSMVSTTTVTKTILLGKNVRNINYLWPSSRTFMMMNLMEGLGQTLPSPRGSSSS